jgi:hypothetical protein
MADVACRATFMTFRAVSLKVVSRSSHEDDSCLKGLFQGAGMMYRDLFSSVDGILGNAVCLIADFFYQVRWVNGLDIWPEDNRFLEYDGAAPLMPKCRDFHRRRNGHAARQRSFLR